jgi:hypothetical protein
MTTDLAMTTDLTTDQRTSDERLIGTWQLKHVDETPPVASTEESEMRWGDGDRGETISIFAPGGGVTSISTGSPATALGAWKVGAGDQFEAVFVVYDFSTSLKFMLKSQGRLAGTVTGDRMEGRFTFEVTDPSGKLLEVEAGTICGTRLAP